MDPHHQPQALPATTGPRPGEELAEIAPQGEKALGASLQVLIVLVR
jgi:hypothetical protein